VTTVYTPPPFQGVRMSIRACRQLWLSSRARSSLGVAGLGSADGFKSRQVTNQRRRASRGASRGPIVPCCRDRATTLSATNVTYLLHALPPGTNNHQVHVLGHARSDRRTCRASSRPRASLHVSLSVKAAARQPFRSRPRRHWSIRIRRWKGLRPACRRRDVCEAADRHAYRDLVR